MRLKEATLTGGRSLIPPKGHIGYSIYSTVNACFGAHCVYTRLYCKIYNFAADPAFSLKLKRIMLYLCV